MVLQQAALPALYAEGITVMGNMENESQDDYSNTEIMLVILLLLTNISTTSDFNSIGRKIWREATVRILWVTVALLEPPMGKKREMF